MTEHDSGHDDPHDVVLPQSVIDSFARFILPEIRTFYSTPEGQQAFREWHEQRLKQNSS